MNQEFMNFEGTPSMTRGKDHADPLAMNVVDFESIRVSLASPEDIAEWSYGEVTKPETINYRTQKAEKDGLFSERIFGPVKDYECSCGKYKRNRYKGIICDKCGVEVAKSNVRRHRMGHIELRIPVAHIWYLRNIPGRIAMVLDKSVQDIEKVVYYSSYIITEVKEDVKKDYVRQIQQEYEKKMKELQGKAVPSEEDLASLREFKNQNVDALQALRKWNILSEVDFRLMSMKFGGLFKAQTGSAVLREIFEQMDLEKIVQDLETELEGADGAKAQKIMKKIRFFGGMLKAKIRPEWMFLTRIPIIPPDLRPMVALDGGRFATSDLNDLYRRVINRNNRLKKLMELNAPDVIVRNEKRMLQEAVDALIDNSMRRGQSTVTASTGQKRALKSLADVLKGKQGRFRQNLLGKRVDYSGRSVIVVGPDLNIDQCGIPKEMALELFKPFIINRLIEEDLAYNIRVATRLIEQRIDRVWDILDEITREKFVLLNRAPTLHRLSIQAFRPVLIEGKAIQLHPMVCSPFNADFDGDQMAVHVPLSQEALKEAKELMLSSHNILKPSDGAPASTPGQDMVLGAYYVTMIIPRDETQPMSVFRNFEDALQAQDQDVIGLREEIEIRYERKVHEQKIITTVGRILFNEILPPEYGFINETIGKKELKKIISRALEMYPQEEVGVLLDAIKRFGFKHMTRSGLSWAMSDFHLPKGKEALIETANTRVEEINQQYAEGLLTKQERYSQIIDIWMKTQGEVGEFVAQNIDKGGAVHTMIDSGARGSIGQLMQMVGMKGLVVSPSGNIIETPIKSSFVDGLSEVEYFISTHGGRKGLVDTALKTATSGYLTRRLCDVCQDVVVTEVDCHDTVGIKYLREDAEKCGDSLENFVFGRTSVQDIIDPETKEVLAKAGEVITRKQAKVINTSSIQQVHLRSVVACKTVRGVCQTCYGFDLGRNKLVALGEAVGIVTAQSIGEPGTQLTMRTFHFGGSAGAADVTKGLPRVEEIFEARSPRTPAIMSKTTGVVVDIKDVAGEVRIKVREAVAKEGAKPEIVDYVGTSAVDIPFVKIGQKVSAGDPLTEGHVELASLYEVGGIDALSRYIVKEVLDIYNSQGAGISNKHVEMIIRQMTSRFQVIDAGTSEFLKGQLITRDQLVEFNNQVKDEKEKIQVTPLLQGITKVSLNTESFLSAASFQNTTKVLIDASLFGKEDKLRGLKENVIIGRLIPAGTGFEGEKPAE